MGCDVVTAAYEDDEFDGSDFGSSSSCSPAPALPSLSEVMERVANARARVRAALFIGGDWTDELSFSHYYHQHWANQMLHLTSLAALYFALFWAAAERHFVLPAAIAVIISAAYTAIDVPLGGAFLVGLSALAGAATALVATIGPDGHQAKRGVWTVCWALSQLAGHAAFEGRLPAFRPAEALVVTPALMVLENVNSFAAVHRGVEYEITRQAAVLDAGGVLAQETRTWDDKTSSTVVLRVKEGDADYRYFPEPDLPPLTLSAATLAAWRDALPELPAEKRARYVAGLGLSEYDAWVLADDAETARYFDAVVAAGADAKAAANWVMGDVLKEVRAAKLETVPACALSPAALAEMVTMITDGVISGKIAKGLLPELVVSGGSPAAMVEERGLKQITDAGEIGALVEGVLAANPKEVDLYRNGKTKLFGFFVGKVLAASGGRADPQRTNDIVQQQLAG